MAPKTRKIRTNILELEHAADVALGAVEADAEASATVRQAVSRLHDYAREAKQVIVGSGDDELDETDELDDDFDDDDDDDDEDVDQGAADLGEQLDEQGTLRGLIAAAEEAADHALEVAGDDPNLTKGAKAAIQEAHDQAKKTKDLF